MAVCLHTFVCNTILRDAKHQVLVICLLLWFHLEKWQNHCIQNGRKNKELAECVCVCVCWYMCFFCVIQRHIHIFIYMTMVKPVDCWNVMHVSICVDDNAVCIKLKSCTILVCVHLYYFGGCALEYHFVNSYFLLKDAKHLVSVMCLLVLFGGMMK